MKIRFTRDELYETEGRNKGHQFKEGEVYDLSDDQAQRWLRRGAAVATESQERLKPVTRVGERRQTERTVEPQPVAAEASEEIEIPGDWRSHHHMARLALARRLTDQPVEDVAGADEVIAAEAERRSAD